MTLPEWTKDPYNAKTDCHFNRAVDVGYERAKEPPKYAHCINGPPITDINALTLATWFAIGAEWQYNEIKRKLDSAQEDKK